MLDPRSGPNLKLDQDLWAPPDFDLAIWGVIPAPGQHPRASLATYDNLLQDKLAWFLANVSPEERQQAVDLALDIRLGSPGDVYRSRDDLWAYLVERPAFNLQRAQGQILDLVEGQVRDRPRDPQEQALAKEELESGECELAMWLGATLGSLQ